MSDELLLQASNNKPVRRMSEYFITVDQAYEHIDKHNNAKARRFGAGLLLAMAGVVRLILHPAGGQRR